MISRAVRPYAWRVLSANSSEISSCIPDNRTKAEMRAPSNPGGVHFFHSKRGAREINQKTKILALYWNVDPSGRKLQLRRALRDGAICGSFPRRIFERERLSLPPKLPLALSLRCGHHHTTFDCCDE